jgi:N-acetylneuraminate epimerase
MFIQYISPISILLVLIASLAHGEAILQIQSAQITPLPVRQGVAGAFGGASEGALLVAGGANFPDRPPWEGGIKTWHDAIYVLADPAGQWQSAGRLPRPLAYGVAVTTAEGVVCIGGSDFARHYADCFLLSWEKGRVVNRPLPPLPKPIANACGAVLGKTIYIAGGTDSPDATKALGTFYALDLSQPKAKWQSLPTWPGPGRMMACAAACDGAFYLLSGISLTASPEGKPERSYLRDAYRYLPGQGWRPIAALPRPAAAAPSPAPVWGTSIVILGGDDGSRLGFQPVAQHPGFAKTVIGYNSTSGRWSSLGRTPVSRATLPTVPWRGAIILPSGEVRPGVRSPEVWSLRFSGTPQNKQDNAN